MKSSYGFNMSKRWKDERTIDDPSYSKCLTEKRKIGAIPMARWCQRDGLQLKQVSAAILQSHFNGFWYHVAAQPEIEEVKGPYRNRTDAKRAYEAFLADQALIVSEVIKEVGYDADDHPNVGKKNRKKK